MQFKKISIEKLCRWCLFHGVQLSKYTRVSRTCCRKFSTSTSCHSPKSQLMKKYEDKKKSVYERKIDIRPVDVCAVFANNEISFRHISVYGFDYDYTLANYSDHLHLLIYKMALENLVSKYGYPNKLRSIKFDAGFPIRGLHFDTEKGYLMKLDSFSHVQLGAVYRGHRKINNWDVVKEYEGTLISVDSISKGTNKDGHTIHQQMDLFSLPFLSLLSNVVEYFIEENILFDPGYIYYDVEKATQEVHLSGKMHQAIIDDLDRYLPKKPDLVTFLNRLVNNKKKLFMITNSSYKFVDKGMTHLIGPEWRELFEVTITNARKPRFFSNVDRAFRPFRLINPVTGHYHWDQVQGFQKHGVYAEGNINLFTQFTGYEGPSVIYFGDHVYSDLMDPVLRYGWRTGAIIPELERELKICNSESYIRDVYWLLTLEDLLTDSQINKVDEHDSMQRLKQERKELRARLKSRFNPYFGSMFRTYHNPTSFSRRMTRYADLYTSSLENLLKYNDQFHFFPRRNALPHEQNFDTHMSCF